MDVDKERMDDACAEYAAYVSAVASTDDFVAAHEHWQRVVEMLGYPALETDEVGRALMAVWQRLRGGSDG